MKPKIDLRAWREKAASKDRGHPTSQKYSLTQADVAARMGITQSQVSRMEDNPENVSMTDLIGYCQAIGVDPATVIRQQSLAAGIDPGKPFSTHDRNVSLLCEYAKVASPSLEDLDTDVKPSRVIALADRWRERPKVALVGPFDSGKSTIINSLLGQAAMPTRWQPATSVPIVIRHVSERPEWLAHDVVMLGVGFEPTRWRDEAHSKEHQVVAGDLDILQKHALRSEDEEEGGTNTEAAFALVFLTAPILHSCTLIDLPGDEDTVPESAATASTKLSADVVIFVSQFAGFFSAPDLSRLSQTIRSLPEFEAVSTNFEPLANLFVVASHCDPSKSDEEIAMGLDRATKRAWMQIEKGALKERVQRTGRPISSARLRERMFTFWKEDENRRRGLEEDLKRLLSTYLPEVWRALAAKEVADLRSMAKNDVARQIDAYRTTLAEFEQLERHVEDAERREPERRSRIEKKRVQVEKLIDSLHVQAISLLKAEYRARIHAQHVHQVIKENFSEKKEAQQYAAGLVLEQLITALNENTRVLGEQLKISIEEYLDEFEQAPTSFGTAAASVSVPFNVKGAFLGGIAGAGVVGALAFWAASLGNLGAYIITAKVVGVLASLGISVGGTAAATALLGAIGGPIVAAAGIFVLVAVAVWGLFGPSWQERLAKKIVDTFNDKNVLEKFADNISNFWDQTRTAFAAAADAVEKKSEDRIREFKRLVTQKVSSREEIERLIEKLSESRDFFGGIPWPQTPPGTDGPTTAKGGA